MADVNFYEVKENESGDMKHVKQRVPEEFPL
jgi:hypothetical protein